MANWLLKTEPDVFSIDDLAKAGKTGEPWNGIRNYQAWNFLREMTPGDRLLIYHSSCASPGIVGQGEVISAPGPVRVYGIVTGRNECEPSVWSTLVSYTWGNVNRYG